MNVLVTLRQARQVRFLLLFNLLLPEVISGFCVLHGREFTARLYWLHQTCEKRQLKGLIIAMHGQWLF